MAAQPAGELLWGSTYEIPHLWAGTAAMLSIPRRQMTSVTVQEGKKARKRKGGGQRVLAVLKPLFSTLDHLLHLQEGALTVSVFLFGKDFHRHISHYSQSSDSRVILQNQTSPWWPYLPYRRGASKSGLVAVRAKNPFFLFVYSWILNRAVWGNPQKALFHLLFQGASGRRFLHFESQVTPTGHPTPSQTYSSFQQSSRSWILPGI